MTTSFVSDEMHSPIEDDINASTADVAEFESSQPLILHPTAPENEAHAEAESGNEHRGAQEASLTGLYISHFLSTWNARTYEFAAVVFTVEAFPNTLLPASISGIAQCLAAITFSPSVGIWADQSPSRLESLKKTILVQRLAVLTACSCWMVLLWSGRDTSSPHDVVLKWAVFAVIVILSCIERLAAGGNVVVMERDWVPTLAPSVGDSLHHLNATMRRIDLICKVLAPGFVTLLPTVFSAIESTKDHSVFWSVAVIAAISALSPWVEWLPAQRVWEKNDLLQAPKIMEEQQAQGREVENRNTGTLDQYLGGKASGFVRFCNSAVFLPTISISLLYLSVLTFSSPMITFLLNAGFTLPVVTTARLFSSVLEVSATAVMPWGVKTLRDRPVKYWRPADEDQFELLEEYPPGRPNIDKAEVERVGLWAVWWMTLSLMPAVYGVAGLTSTSDTSPAGLPIPHFSIPMLLGVAFSRIGLWTYDLAYSQLQQTLPPPSLRGEFTGIEQSFVSTAELLQWTMTAILSRPKDFNVLAVISWTSILGAAGCYAWFIRKRRGHLLHVKVSTCCKT
ncbi:hypothetical protein TWF225_008152 [Orbilia oligospora]|nr:hypothetical protein TWF225_008152 [Orbilia oligospora]KAF3261377.1 hypothetical protein TWF128_003143 [Orbilia oligospora]KAF3268861.1 hypothetical protein TWF217_010155 [Orbilia oligospora]KAF3293259.1 hypothetical protein TWF132_004904 [Orbilia oligospora]